jgi:hypothetical protein
MTEALTGKNVTWMNLKKLKVKLKPVFRMMTIMLERLFKKESAKKYQSVCIYRYSKAKTLEVFGTKDREGKPQPFHLYSMRQAIEEGFILDVLKKLHNLRYLFQIQQKD